MKDAVKRTIDRVKLYFRRRKVLRDILRQWGDSLVMQQDAIKIQQQPSMTFLPEQVTFDSVPVSQPIHTEPDPELSKSVDELVFAIDQEAAATTQSPFTRQDPMLAAINRRIGV